MWSPAATNSGRSSAVDADGRKRLDWLGRSVETYGWCLHPFILLSNRDHLFVKTPAANLSAGMHHDNVGYAGYSHTDPAAPDTSFRDVSRGT